MFGFGVFGWYLGGGEGVIIVYSSLDSLLLLPFVLAGVGVDYDVVAQWLIIIL